MAIQNRDVTIKNVFASDANTTIPNPPVAGQSYRNTAVTSGEIADGWPYKEIVDSAKFNEMMYEYTTICKQLETYGFLPWSSLTDYEIGSCCLATDGVVYQAKAASGPSTSAQDPVYDTSHDYWDVFYYPNFTADRALISNANGKVSASSVTSTELGYLSGATSSVQTQLNNKANNNAVVHTTGNELIYGTKTFNDIMYAATPNFDANGTSVPTTAWVKRITTGHIQRGQIGTQGAIRTITFSSPFANTNYSVMAMCRGNGADDAYSFISENIGARTTSSCRIYAYGTAAQSRGFDWIAIGA